MKRAILLVSAGSAMLAALGRRAAETVGEIRDAAEVGPDTLRLLEAEGPRNNESLAWRIRSVLGPRNDDTRAVIDLIDELCEELDADKTTDVLFDGFAVYDALDDKAKQRTGPENVSDVLDAVVRILREDEGAP
ncbi:hypothetical protein [Methylophaga sp.]|uniref:hypothetical protein n=1 Tax=Methylophaga sp. TaxID=2024840 RepID=UPI0025E85FC9|nr:hypothetical protein [Methylophaga sp.]